MRGINMKKKESIKVIEINKPDKEKAHERLLLLIKFLQINNNSK